MIDVKPKGPIVSVHLKPRLSVHLDDATSDAGVPVCARKGVYTGAQVYKTRIGTAMSGRPKEYRLRRSSYVVFVVL